MTIERWWHVVIERHSEGCVCVCVCVRVCTCVYVCVYEGVNKRVSECIYINE